MMRTSSYDDNRAARLHIRSLTLADLNPLEKWEQSYFFNPWSKSLLQTQLCNDAHCVNLAITPIDEPNALRGYLLSHFVAEEASIEKLAVSHEHRRSGLGTLLMEAALLQLQQRSKLNRLTLEVRANDLAAQNFYTALGFAKIAVRPGYYRGKENQIEDAWLLAIEVPILEQYFLELRRKNRAID